MRLFIMGNGQSMRGDGVCCAHFQHVFFTYDQVRYQLPGYHKGSAGVPACAGLSWDDGNTIKQPANHPSVPACYQLDLTTPGISPLSACSRKQMRHMPNLRI